MDSIDDEMITQIVLRSNVRHNSLRSNFKDQETVRTVKNKLLTELLSQLTFLKNESHELKSYIKKLSEKISNDITTGDNDDILFERIGMPLSN
jgi:hypothetical protein